jgi:hypothetical protein
MYRMMPCSSSRAMQSQLLSVSARKSRSEPKNAGGTGESPGGSADNAAEFMILAEAVFSSWRGARARLRWVGRRLFTGRSHRIITYERKEYNMSRTE